MNLACVRLNRRFIDIELNEEYFTIAEKRLNKELSSEVEKEG